MARPPLGDGGTVKSLCDLFLDTALFEDEGFVDLYSYGAHGTASEMIGSGVPLIVSPLDAVHASRVSARFEVPVKIIDPQSIVIGSIGRLPIARNLDDYADVAVAVSATMFT
jgi:hypothetical protein